MKPPVPFESEEQMALAEYLDLRGFCWFHPANESDAKPQYRHKQRLLGLKPGVPDVIILDKVPEMPEIRGVAIELKRTRGSRSSDEQVNWAGRLRARGWLVFVCKGAGAAIKVVDALWPPGEEER
jgi:hypothetical protein